MKAVRTSREQTIRRKAIDIDNNDYPVCEGCKDNHVFPHILHHHHLTPLSEASPFETRYLLFLCPNCHALIHLMRKYKQRGPNLQVADDLEFWLDERMPPDIVERLWDIATGNISALEVKHGLVFRNAK